MHTLKHFYTYILLLLLFIIDQLKELIEYISFKESGLFGVFQTSVDYNERHIL
jgi:hypothetical protein